MISTCDPVSPPAAATVPFLERVPLFADLSPAELLEMSWLVSPFACGAGERLFRQGDPGDALYCIDQGRIELSVRAPGGDDVSLGTVGPGQVLGEMALLDSGPRSATAVALEPTCGFVVPALGFSAFRAGLRSSGFKILRHLAALLAHRLRAHAGEAPGGDPVSVDLTRLGGQRAPATDLDRQNLLLFPTFRDFSPAELEEFLARSSVVTLPRGRVVCREGDGAESCFVVVRGAVLVCVERNGEHRKLAVEGPGGVVGHLALIAGGERSATCVARENTVLLELSRTDFEALFASASGAAFKLFAAMTERLCDEVRRVNQRMGLPPTP